MPENHEIIDAEEVNEISPEEMEQKRQETIQKLEGLKTVFEKMKEQAVAQAAAGPGGGATGVPGPEGLLAFFEREGIRFKVTRTVPSNPEYDIVTILLKDVELYDAKRHAEAAAKLAAPTLMAEPNETSQKSRAGKPQPAMPVKDNK